MLHQQFLLSTETTVLQPPYLTAIFIPNPDPKAPHTVANLLLLHFREMPQPLLEFKLYDKWVQALGPPIACWVHLDCC